MNYLFIGNYTEKALQMKEYLREHNPSWLEEINPDIILVAGGDGSMLHAIRNNSFYQKPFLGISCGTLNFLMNDLDIKDIESLSFEEVKTKTIKVSVNGQVFNALNEVSIGGGFMDYHQFTLESKSFDNFSFKGQGLIVSTPLGSTAINYNNGGQIIPSLELPVWSISTCIAQRSKGFRKLVESTPLKITLGKQKGLYHFDSRIETASSRLFIDGGTDIVELKEGDEVLLEDGFEITLLFVSKKDFELKRLRF